GPLDDGAVAFPPALVLCRRGGPAFADGDDPCRPPLAKLDPRHILPVTNADILPRGLAPADYVLAFLKEFGLADIDASTAIRLPGVKLPVVIGKGLFIDKATGDWKLSKNARDQHVLLLARTIKSPWEIWQVPAKLSGKACTTLRMIRLFRDGEKQVGGFGVCNLVNGRGWVGTTAFMPKADRSERRILEYLEAQRTGVLLYREP
ncbi:phage head morphogenesis protein, partial [Desulfovibrio oxamicus]